MNKLRVQYPILDGAGVIMDLLPTKRVNMSRGWDGKKGERRSSAGLDGNTASRPRKSRTNELEVVTFRVKNPYVITSRVRVAWGGSRNGSASSPLH